MITKTRHCCELMVTNLEDGRVQVFYDESMRMYYINVVDSNKIVAFQVLFYCPWCSQKMPDSLNVEYYKTLRKEYGIEWYQIQNKDKNLPEEFKSDEWWKKRGL